MSRISLPAGLRFFVLLLGVTAALPAASQSPPMVEPMSVLVIDFGGTIAGKAHAPNADSYESGGRDIGEILAEMRRAIAGARGDMPGWLAAVTVDDSLPSGGSSDLTEKEWVLLHDRISAVARDGNTRGVVVTHGTDTLEETAFFLHLTLKTDIPVVVTGAMRASNQFGADGPLNLYNAIAVAADPQAAGMGVMVVLNDEIYSARDVSKTHTLSPATFQARSSGPIGHVYFGKPRFFAKPLRPFGKQTPFRAADVLTAPATDPASRPRFAVDILYFYAGNRGDDLRAAAERGSDGIIWAASGAGSVGGAAAEVLETLCDGNRDAVPPMIYASRTGAGPVLNGADAGDSCLRVSGAGDLNPQKARILLMLALSQGWTEAPRLRRAFERY